MGIEDGFKETEIGPIPVDWEVVPLQEAATFTRKPRGLNLADHEAIPFIPMALVPDNSTLIEQYELRPGDSIRSGTYCERGNILLAKITPSFENGKQGIVGDLPLDFAYATTEVYPIQARPGCLDQMFLFHFLRLPNVRADIAGKMEGSTGRQRVPRAVIENYPIPLPPLPEQRRIAHVLSAIQRAIAAQDDLIAAAREVKRSLMQRLFTYGPGPEPAPTKETEIGEIPEHWEVVRLGEVADKPQYGYTASASQHPVGPKFLRITDIQNGRVSWLSVPFCEIDERGLTKYRLEPGDLLFARIGATTGKTYLVTECPSSIFASYLIRVRVKSERLLPGYAHYFTNTETYWRQIDAAKGGRLKKGVNIPVLSSLLLPLPPLCEQHEISHSLSALDRKIETEEQRKAALQELFKSMLHQLMTGQVRLK
ncbi:MAG: restriction endonuclease subunit S [Anaerolineales bacterium]|nr:restriction endonuclease subunit S [Anaerolineales bacterium]